MKKTVRFCITIFHPFLFPFNHLHRTPTGFFDEVCECLLGVFKREEVRLKELKEAKGLKAQDSRIRWLEEAAVHFTLAAATLSDNDFSKLCRGGARPFPLLTLMNFQNIYEHFHKLVQNIFRSLSYPCPKLCQFLFSIVLCLTRLLLCYCKSHRCTYSLPKILV